MLSISVFGVIDNVTNTALERGIEWIKISWDTPTLENFTYYEDPDYCERDRACSLSTLTVNNLTVSGDFVNVSVTNYNVTGNISVSECLKFNNETYVCYLPTNTVDISSAFYVDDDGNVGIGISNPNKKLHIYGEDIRLHSPGTNSDLILQAGASSESIVRKNNGGDFHIIQDGTERFTIDQTSGAVGISNTNPDVNTAIDIQGDGRVNGTLNVTGDLYVYETAHIHSLQGLSPIIIRDENGTEVGNITNGKMEMQYFQGDGSQLTNLNISYLNGTVTLDGDVIISGNLNMSGNNITNTNIMNATYYYGDGRYLYNVVTNQTHWNLSDDTLYLYDLDYKVSIGGTNATYNLELVGKNNFNNYMHIYTNGSPTGGIYLGTDGEGDGNFLVRYRDGTTGVWLNPNTYSYFNYGLGLGLNSVGASKMLDVNGTAQITDTVLFGEDTGTLYNELTFYTTDVESQLIQFADDRTGLTGSTDGVVMGSSSDHEVYISTSEEEEIYLLNNGSIKMTIAPSGNVGIGTILPSYLLEVSGTTKIDNGQLIIDNGASNSAIISGPELNDYIDINADDKVHIYSNGVEKINLGGYYQFDSFGSATSVPNRIKTFSDNNNHYSYLAYAKSHNNTVDVETKTLNNEYIGGQLYFGVNNVSSQSLGAYMLTRQTADSRAYPPTSFIFATSNGDSPAVAKMSINSDGKVGIGDSTPDYLLDIASSDIADIEVTGTSAWLRLISSTASKDWRLISWTDGTLYFQENAYGNALALSSSGNATFKKLSGTYTGGSAYVCVNNAGTIYASESACP